jgi:hypothetical protein
VPATQVFLADVPNRFGNASGRRLILSPRPVREGAVRKSAPDLLVASAREAALDDVRSLGYKRDEIIY